MFTMNFSKIIFLCVFAFYFSDNFCAAADKPRRVFFEDPRKVVGIHGETVFDNRAPEVWGRLFSFASSKGIGPYRKFGMLHKNPLRVRELEEQVSYDACLETDCDVSADENIKRMTIPRGEYLTTTHFGSCQYLGMAYARIMRHIYLKERLRIKPDSPIFEEYIVDPIDGAENPMTIKVYFPILEYAEFLRPEDNFPAK